MACICDTFPGGLCGYVRDEDRHPPGKSSLHMHIELRGTVFYRVEWGTDRNGERFAEVLVGDEGSEKLARRIERWAKHKAFDELTRVYWRVIKGLDFEKVEWS